MRAAIALGSNLEPRAQNLQAACQAIRNLHDGTGPLLCSQVYETSPVDCPPGSPPFLNAVMEIETSRPPLDLLRTLQILEITLGRPASHERNAPRSIDLDILYYDNLTHSAPDLTLPHPRITSRQFVLRPLADIRPDLILPGCSASVAILSRSLENSEKLTLFSESIY